MAKVIAIYNQKGGVGKTVLTWALAQMMEADGLAVLSIDMDSQCSLTYTMTGSVSHQDADIMRALLSPSLAGLYIRPTKGCGHIIPGSMQIDGLTLYARSWQQDTLLRDMIRCMPADMYDYILLDCPPGVGLGNINALTAADYLITPAHLDTYSIQGISGLMQTVRSITEHTNHDLRWLGVVITDYKPQLTLSRHLMQFLQDRLAAVGVGVIGYPVRYTVRVREAICCHELIDKKCKSFVDYKSILNAIKDMT